MNAQNTSQHADSASSQNLQMVFFMGCSGAPLPPDKPQTACVDRSECQFGSQQLSICKLLINFGRRLAFCTSSLSPLGRVHHTMADTLRGWHQWEYLSQPEPPGHLQVQMDISTGSGSWWTDLTLAPSFPKKSIENPSSPNIWYQEWPINS